MIRLPKQSVSDDSSIIDDSDASSPADEDDDDDENFVFVPRPPAIGAAIDANINDSLIDNISVEDTSPFNADVAVRRRTMERIDSCVSVGSRWVALKRLLKTCSFFGHFRLCEAFLEF